MILLMLVFFFFQRIHTQTQTRTSTRDWFVFLGEFYHDLYLKEFLFHFLVLWVSSFVCVGFFLPDVFVGFGA